MECHKCNQEMILVQYIEFDDLKEYLEVPVNKELNINYLDWLKKLKQGDVVLTRFTKKEYNKDSCKYYLRIVEQRTLDGIKLKHLSKTFNGENGELIYGDVNGTENNKSIYKIVEINSMVDLIIRKHCISKEAFSIKKLNNELSKTLAGRS